MYEVGSNSNNFEFTKDDNRDEVVNLLRRSVDEVGSVRVVDTDPEVHEDLVKRMRSSTFKVDVVNANRDIVLPMISEMQNMDLLNRQVRARQHLETSLYMSRIVDILLANNSGDQEMGEGIILATQRFFRKPFWMHLGHAVSILARTVGGIAWKTLFGRSNRQTIEEKILTAIKQQTEFLRTGEIKQEQSILDRILNGGLIGAPVKAISELALSSALNISRSNAQLREIQRKNGEEIGLSITGVMSDFLYKNSVNRMGRQSGILGENGNRETFTEREYKRENNIASNKDAMSMVEVFRQIYIPLFVDQKNDIHRIAISTGVLANAVRDREMHEDRVQSGMRESRLFDQESLKIRNEQLLLEHQNTKFNKDIVKYDAILVKEAVKARHARYYETLISVGNMLINGVRGVLQATLTLPTTLASLIGGLGLGSVIGNGKGALLGKGGLLGLSGVGGFSIGSIIYENFISGTDGANFIGKVIDNTLKYIGFDTPTSTPEEKSRGILERFAPAPAKSIMKGADVIKEMYDKINASINGELPAKSMRERDYDRDIGGVSQYSKDADHNPASVIPDRTDSAVAAILRNFTEERDSMLLSEQRKMNKNLEEMITLEKNKQQEEALENSPFPVGLDSGLIMNIYKGVR